MKTLLLVVLCFGALAASAAPVKAYAIIVGNNDSVQPDVKPLRFADDDAAKYYELLRPAAAELVLLTVMDADTQRVHQDLPAVSIAPSRANMFAALDRLNTKMAADSANGFEPTLYFIYVGHGHVGGAGQGFLSFSDGPLTGEELWSRVVAPSKAAYNHLILDACNSYLMVASRGEGDEGPDASAAIREYASRHSPTRFPNTGAVVSTNSAKETHEWSVFSGGVFSQEVRSGLAGAADSNGDGRVEYSELEAFLAAANLAVDDPRARPEAFVRAPAQDQGRALMDLADARYSHLLHLPASFSGRFHLEDARGVRYLDAHKAPDSDLYLALVDSPQYFLRTEDSEARIPLRGRGTVDVRALKWLSATQAARGSVAEAFRDLLFKVPYGPAFYRGFVARTALPPARRATRSFPPEGLAPRAVDQPFKNPYQ